MTPFYTDPMLTLYLGDCLEVMPTLEAGSVDAVVTDPPYGLEFMGKEWDRLGATVEAQSDIQGWTNGSGVMVDGAAGPFAGSGQRIRYGSSAKSMQVWHERWAREAFRLLRPGGHLLAFGGTRTYHRLASAIEDAGFEIRDCLVWAYASGFPKSLDVGRAIDRAAGAEREDVLQDKPRAMDNAVLGKGLGVGMIERRPATDDAKRWDGWGTALKPAWEPIVMARKPLQGTVAANVLRHGVGALNIDGTRIGTDTRVDDAQRADGPYSSDRTWSTSVTPPRVEAKEYVGRWPANVVLTADEEGRGIFDGDTPGVVGGGMTHSQDPATRANPNRRAWFEQDSRNGYAVQNPGGYGDTGTYSRFFLIPKEARAGREPAVRGQLAERGGTFDKYYAPLSDPRMDRPQQRLPRENVHPTVKPLELMRHLVRLVTPPGGTVLDCFLGSGTTALAAINEGFRCIGIEREAEYMAITMARLHGTQAGMGL